MRTSQPLDVAVIGAGIGGLTAAIALKHQGIDAHLYESGPSLRAAGAGLLLSPNAMQVLRRLGLAEQVIAAGRALEHAELRDVRSGVLQRIDFGYAKERFGEPTVAIHRRRLHEILAAQIPAGRIRFGAVCERVGQDDGWPTVRFTNGRVISPDLVIGADGLRSRVREFVAPGTPLRYSGQTSFRAISSLELLPKFAGTSTEIWAPHCRFGYAAIAPGETYWFATLDAEAGKTVTHTESMETLRELLASFPSPVNHLLDLTNPADVIRTDMYDLRPFAGWSHSRVVLVGDAAHATTPNLGQGAAQAIEDAFVLADRIANSARLEDALQSYEAIRQPKTRFIVERSRQIGRVAHVANPIGRAVRNLAVRFTPASVARRQLDRMYALDY
jgi:2-polyprenyl-6-methoxyphenol hydroxylase-like FAD-dependent oxidoreductase